MAANYTTISGKIIKTDGTPLESSNISFVLSVINPAGTCVIYDEQISGVDMTNSGGNFEIALGSGTKSFPTSPSFTAAAAFINSVTLNCQGGGTYVPATNDNRKLRVKFYDGTSWRSFTPDLSLNAVPYSWQANNSDQLGGKNADSFVLKSSINNATNCNGGQFLTWNATTMTFGCDTATAVGSVTSVSSVDSYLTVTNGTSTPILAVNIGTAAGTVAAGNDARFSDDRVPKGVAGGDLSGTYPNPSVSKIAGYPLNLSTTPAANQVLQYDGSAWTAQNIPAQSTGTVTSITAGAGLTATGGTITTSGTIGLGSALTSLNSDSATGYLKRTAAGVYGVTVGNTAASTNTLVLRDGSGISGFYGLDINGATSGKVSLLSPSIVTNYTLTLPGAQGNNGQVLMNNGSGLLSWSNVPAAPGAACGAGDVLTYTGSAFTCVPDQVGSASGGITTLNGQTASSQSFATGTGGTAPVWNTASAVHTLNIPYARTSGVTAGLISKTEYDTFSAKQAALGYTPLSASANLSDLGSVATARTNLGLGTAALRSVPTASDAGTSEVVLGNDSRLTNSRAPAGTAGGDLSGTYPNPSVAKIQGVTVSSTAPTSGHVLKYNGTSWTGASISASEVSGLSADYVPRADIPQCSASTTLVYNPTSKTFSCVSIVIGSNFVSFPAQTKNTFFAGGTSGTTTPTFRALVTADLPDSVVTAAKLDSSTVSVWGPTSTGTTYKGQVRSVNSSGVSQANTGTTIDWNNGNSQTMSSACTSTTLSNMADGATYILAVSETSSTKCVFSASGMTFLYSPANSNRVSGSETVYTFLRVGTKVYVSWIAGFAP